MVLLPAKGSKYDIIFESQNFMKNSATPMCILAGCGLKPFLRQYSCYLPFDKVFENGNTFGGIAPPLFLRKDRFPTRCPDERLPELYCFEARVAILKCITAASCERRRKIGTPPAPILQSGKRTEIRHLTVFGRSGG